MTDQQTNDLAGWTSIVISLIAFIVLFLKGRWTVIIVAIAATVLSRLAIFGTYWHHIITEPLRWWPLVAIFRLAKPSSRWADWFYNEPKMQLARERYPTANPVPRSLRKQAIRNLRAIGRGDYSALGGEAQKAPGENEWKTIADRLSEAGWTWGCTERVDSQGKTIFVADAHHGGKSFAVRADNKLTAFSELERQVRAEFASILPSIPSAIPPPPVDISVSRPKAPTKRPLYATVFAVIIIVMLGVAARSFVDRRKSETNLGQSSQKQKESEAAKFATYARNLREQVVQEVEPQAFVPTSRPVTQRFPWKSNIVTTVFWIGEKEH